MNNTEPPVIPLWKWLLLLLPSAPMLLLPWIKNPWPRPPTGDATADQNHDLFVRVRIVFTVAIAISVFVALAFEKWRHGAVRHPFRVIWNGFTILAVNGLISFYGVLWLINLRTNR